MDETTVQDVRTETTEPERVIAHGEGDQIDFDRWNNEDQGHEHAFNPNPTRAARIHQFYQEGQAVPLEDRNITWRGLKLLNACLGFVDFNDLRTKVAGDSHLLLLPTLIESTFEANDPYHRIWAIRGLYMSPQEALALTNALIELHLKRRRAWIKDVSVDALRAAVVDTLSLVVNFDHNDPMCVAQWLSDGPHGLKPYTVLCRVITKLITYEIVHDGAPYACDDVLSAMRSPSQYRMCDTDPDSNALDLLMAHAPKGVIGYSATNDYVTVVADNGVLKIVATPGRVATYAQGMIEDLLEAAAHLEANGNEMKQSSLPQNIDLSCFEPVFAPAAEVQP